MHILENPKPVKLKQKTIELVCVCVLEHIKTNYPYTRFKLKQNKPRFKSSCRSSSPRRFDPNTIHRA